MSSPLHSCPSAIVLEFYSYFFLPALFFFDLSFFLCSSTAMAALSSVKTASLAFPAHTSLCFFQSLCWHDVEQ